jgi:hypothetical protein
MRICTTKDGKLIEMQSEATKGTLTKNALNAGYKIGDIEEKEVSESEWSSIIDGIRAKEASGKETEKENKLTAIEKATTIKELREAVIKALK